MTPNCAQRSFIIVAIATMPGSGVPMLRSPVNCWRPRFATEAARALDRVVRDFGRALQNLARIRIRVGGVLVNDVANRDERVEQRLVAELRAAALLNTFDARREHLVEILERNARTVLRECAGTHEPRAPDRARAAADVLRDDHADLEQEAADRAAVELVPFLLDRAEARRQRDAEIGVAGVRIELAEVLLVLECGSRDGFDRCFYVRQGDFFHLMLRMLRRRSNDYAPAMASRSFSVTSTFGASPSSGTTSRRFAKVLVLACTCSW